MGVSGKLHQMDNAVVDSENWVISGIHLRSPLKPVFTKPKEDEEEEASTTPTSAESRIPSRLPCPPAPRKRKPSASSRSSSCRCGGGVTEFFNPPDLEKIFMRRVN